MLSISAIHIRYNNVTRYVGCVFAIKSKTTEWIFKRVSLIDRITHGEGLNEYFV